MGRVLLSERACTAGVDQELDQEYTGAGGQKSFGLHVHCETLAGRRVYGR